ncbi:MAG TPA: phytanoyl-CoA dioxygenase family protein [Chloroflexota bacterium]|nr:phytanoyl-CoA dioxygenase family protein [Chloroflexota bacterium]
MVVAAGPRIDVERFREEGYLAVEGVLDLERDLQPVVGEYEELLDRLCAEAYAAGTIPSDFSDQPFVQRLASFLSAAGKGAYQAFDISLPLKSATEQTPIHLGPAVFNMLRSESLLDAVEQLIGPEILSNPIQHVRIKPPEWMLPADFKGGLVGQTDWHQDQGVALAEVDETDMLTVWLAITDATEENGCLCVVPRSHAGGMVTHCPAKPGSTRIGLHIPDELRGQDFTPVPLKKGGALFLHRRTMHASLRNVSQGARWSFDLRYQPIGQPTGRPWFPDFPVRSRKDPSSELRDWTVWADMWRQTRARMAADGPIEKTNRWDGSQPVCA